MAKKEDSEKTAEADSKTENDKRLDDLEKIVTLTLASMPIWIGYENEDRRFIEDWYTEMRKKFDFPTKGIRD